MTSVLDFPVDANQVPIGHVDAERAAARELSDFINELPESVYHLSPDDAELAASRVIAVYRATLARAIVERIES